MTHGRKKLFCFRRDDISTFLVIAFLFQFIFPSAVLSYDHGLDEDYVQLLQSSICRAEAPNSQTSGAPAQKIPGVACDLCVVHAAFSLPGVVPTLDLHAITQQELFSYHYEKRQVARLSEQAKGNLAFSRAPPSL